MSDINDYNNIYNIDSLIDTGDTVPQGLTGIQRRYRTARKYRRYRTARKYRRYRTARKYRRYRTARKYRRS